VVQIKASEKDDLVLAHGGRGHAGLRCSYKGGGWRVEGGGWRVEGGGWRIDLTTFPTEYDGSDIEGVEDLCQNGPKPRP